MNERTIKSFLKWPGGKRRILSKIKELLPDGNRFIEPFVGSGTVFLNLNYPKMLVADRNCDLINLFHTVQNDGHGFFEYAKTFFGDSENTVEVYNKNRDLFNSSSDIKLKSALLIYLNKHGFNGLCRYTLKGIYNVPFGKRKVAYFPLKEVEYFYEKIKNVTIKCCDFRELFKEAKLGDVIYCDPPYVPLSNTARLTQFAPFKFDTNDHGSLAECAKNAASIGAKVLISNHDTTFTRELYKDAFIKSLDVQRYIGCNAESRVKTKELLALFA